jgi:hypothetical protein
MSWKYGMFPKDLYLVQGFKTSCHGKISLSITNRLEFFFSFYEFSPIGKFIFKNANNDLFQVWP